MLTRVDAAARSAVEAHEPSKSLGVRIVEAAYSWEHLKAAALRGAESWKRLDTPIELLGVGIDAQSNRLKFKVLSADVAGARELLPRLENDLGVPATIQETVRSVDTVCSSRDNCYGPMKPGIRVNKSSGSHFPPDCTMAFHVSVGTDEQWLTAGHCGYSGSNTWYHSGLGSIGAEKATLYTAGNHDIMRIQMSDSQVSTNVYGESYGPIGGWGLVADGMTVYASRGRSADVISGTVQDSVDSWVSNTASPDITVWGADTSLTSDYGDSGSPVYKKSLNEVWAVGTLSNGTGHIALIEDALDHWTMTIHSQ